MDDHIEPEAFRETFADKADALLDGGAAAVFKETTKRGVTMLTKADKFWLLVVGGGGLYLRDRHQRKKIKGLTKIATAALLENEFLTAFINGLMDPSLDKAVVLKDLTEKLQRLKGLRAA